MADFNLTAQLQLQAPANMAQVAQQMSRGLSGINAQVNLQLSPQARANLARVQQQMQAATSGAGSLGRASTQAAAGMTNMGSAAARAAAQVQAFAASSAGLGKSVQTTGASLLSGASYFERLGAAASAATQRFVAFMAGAAAFLAVTRSIREGVGAGVDFEKQLNRVAQVSGEADRALTVIPETINRLSTSLGTSSSELIKSSLILAQTGLTAKEVAANLETLALAAAAPNFDTMGQTVEGMVAVMRQFKTDAEGTKEAIGAMNEVAAKFAVEASDLVTATRKAGGAFAAAGGDINQLLAIFTSVRSTTRESAEEIATGLRTIFARTQRADVIDELKALQVNLRYTREEAQAAGNMDLDNQFVGPYEAVRRLSEAIKSMPTADPRFSSIIESLGGYRQISRVIPLLQQFGEAEKALGVAQTGSLSLYRSAEKAQETLYMQTLKTKEEFLKLFRAVTESSAFKQFATGALSLASAFASILQYAKPLVPLLLTIGTMQLARAVSGFVGNMMQGPAAINKMAGIVQAPTPRGFAKGGIVPGPAGAGDVVSAMLSPNEFVLREPSTRRLRAKYGDGLLHHLNEKGTLPAQFQDGGQVERYTDGGPRRSHGGLFQTRTPDVGINVKEMRSFFKPFSSAIQMSTTGVNYVPQNRIALLRRHLLEAESNIGIPEHHQGIVDYGNAGILDLATRRVILGAAKPGGMAFDRQSFNTIKTGQGRSDLTVADAAKILLSHAMDRSSKQRISSSVLNDGIDDARSLTQFERFLSRNLANVANYNEFGHPVADAFWGESKYHQSTNGVAPFDEFPELFPGSGAIRGDYDGGDYFDIINNFVRSDDDFNIGYNAGTKSTSVNSWLKHVYDERLQAGQIPNMKDVVRNNPHLLRRHQTLNRLIGRPMRLFQDGGSVQRFEDGGLRGNAGIMPIIPGYGRIKNQNIMELIKFGMLDRGFGFAGYQPARAAGFYQNYEKKLGAFGADSFPFNGHSILNNFEEGNVPEILGDLKRRQEIEIRHYAQSIGNKNNINLAGAMPGFGAPLDFLHRGPQAMKSWERRASPAVMGGSSVSPYSYGVSLHPDVMFRQNGYLGYEHQLLKAIGSDFNIEIYQTAANYPSFNPKLLNKGFGAFGFLNQGLIGHTPYETAGLDHVNKLAKTSAWGSGGGDFFAYLMSGKMPFTNPQTGQIGLATPSQLSNIFGKSDVLERMPEPYRNLHAKGLTSRQYVKKFQNRLGFLRSNRSEMLDDVRQIYGDAQGRIPGQDIFEIELLAGGGQVLANNGLLVPGTPAQKLTPDAMPEEAVKLIRGFRPFRLQDGDLLSSHYTRKDNLKYMELTKAALFDVGYPVHGYQPSRGIGSRQDILGHLQSYGPGDFPFNLGRLGSHIDRVGMGSQSDLLEVMNDLQRRQEIEVRHYINDITKQTGINFNNFVQPYGIEESNKLTYMHRGQYSDRQHWHNRYRPGIANVNGNTGSISLRPDVLFRDDGIDGYKWRIPYAIGASLSGGGYSRNIIGTHLSAVHDRISTLDDALTDKLGAASGASAAMPAIRAYDNFGLGQAAINPHFKSFRANVDPSEGSFLAYLATGKIPYQVPGESRIELGEPSYLSGIVDAHTDSDGTPLIYSNKSIGRRFIKRGYNLSSPIHEGLRGAYEANLVNSNTFSYRKARLFNELYYKGGNGSGNYEDYGNADKIAQKRTNAFKANQMTRPAIKRFYSGIYSTLGGNLDLYRMMLSASHIGTNSIIPTRGYADGGQAPQSTWSYLRNMMFQGVMGAASFLGGGSSVDELGEQLAEQQHERRPRPLAVAPRPRKLPGRFEDGGLTRYNSIFPNAMQLQNHPLLRSYISNQDFVNQPLYSGEISEQQLKMIEEIKQLISSQGGTPQDLTLYRGLSQAAMAEFNQQLGINRPSKAVGKIYNTSGFASTSLSKEIAEQFSSRSDYVLKIHVPKGAAGTGINPGEEEVLFNPGQKLQITGATKDAIEAQLLLNKVAGQRFASGGQAHPWQRQAEPGLSSQDKIPALLTPNEFVFNPDAVRSFGAPALHYMNRHGELPPHLLNKNGGKVRGYNKGGLVQRFTNGEQPDLSQYLEYLNTNKFPSVSKKDGSVKQQDLFAYLQKIASNQKALNVAGIDPGDVASDSLIKLLEKVSAGQYDPSKLDFKAYMGMVVRQEAMDAVRRKEGKRDIIKDDAGNAVLKDGQKQYKQRAREVAVPQRVGEDGSSSDIDFAGRELAPEDRYERDRMLVLARQKARAMVAGADVSSKDLNKLLNDMTTTEERRLLREQHGLRPTGQIPSDKIRQVLESHLNSLDISDKQYVADTQTAPVQDVSSKERMKQQLMAARKRSAPPTPSLSPTPAPQPLQRYPLERRDVLNQPQYRQPPTVQDLLAYQQSQSASLANLPASRGRVPLPVVPPPFSPISLPVVSAPQRYPLEQRDLLNRPRYNQMPTVQDLLAHQRSQSTSLANLPMQTTPSPVLGFSSIGQGATSLADLIPKNRDFSPGQIPLLDDNADFRYREESRRLAIKQVADRRAYRSLAKKNKLGYYDIGGIPFSDTETGIRRANRRINPTFGSYSHTKRRLPDGGIYSPKKLYIEDGVMRDDAQPNSGDGVPIKFLNLSTNRDKVSRYGDTFPLNQSFRDSGKPVEDAGSNPARWQRLPSFGGVPTSLLPTGLPVPFITQSGPMTNGPTTPIRSGPKIIASNVITVATQPPFGPPGGPGSPSPGSPPPGSPPPGSPPPGTPSPSGSSSGGASYPFDRRNHLHRMQPMINASPPGGVMSWFDSGPASDGDERNRKRKGRDYIHDYLDGAVDVGGPLLTTGDTLRRSQSGRLPGDISKKQLQELEKRANLAKQSIPLLSGSSDDARQMQALAATLEKEFQGIAGKYTTTKQSANQAVSKRVMNAVANQLRAAIKGGDTTKINDLKADFEALQKHNENVANKVTPNNLRRAGSAANLAAEGAPRAAELNNQAGRFGREAARLQPMAQAQLAELKKQQVELEQLKGQVPAVGPLSPSPTLLQDIKDQQDKVDALRAGYVATNRRANQAGVAASSLRDEASAINKDLLDPLRTARNQARRQNLAGVADVTVDPVMSNVSSEEATARAVNSRLRQRNREIGTGNVDPMQVKAAALRAIAAGQAGPDVIEHARRHLSGAQYAQVAKAYQKSGGELSPDQQASLQTSSANALAASNAAVGKNTPAHAAIPEVIGVHGAAVQTGYGATGPTAVAPGRQARDPSIPLRQKQAGAGVGNFYDLAEEKAVAKAAPIEKYYRDKNGGQLSQQTVEMYRNQARSSVGPQMERDLISAQQRLLQSLNKQLSSGEAYRMAQQQVADALRKDAAHKVAMQKWQADAAQAKAENRPEPPKPVAPAASTAYDAKGNVLGLVPTVQEASAKGVSAPGAAPIGILGRAWNGIVSSTQSVSRWNERVTNNMQARGMSPMMMGFGLSMLAPYLGMAAQGDAESAVISGREGWHKAGTVASGGLQGAAIGGIAGLQIGGVAGGIAGAALGGAIGMVTSFREAVRELAQIKIDRSVQLFADKLQVLTSLTERAPAGYESAALYQIQDIKRESAKQSYGQAYSWSTLGGYDALQFSAQEDKSYRQNLGPQLPAMNARIQAEISRMIREGTGVPGEKVTQENVFKRLQDNSLNSEILDTMTRLKRVPKSSIIEEQKVFFANRNRQVDIEETNKAAIRGEQANVGSFGRLANNAMAASDALRTLRNVSNNLTETFEANFQAAAHLDINPDLLSRVGTNNSEVTPILELLRNNGGPAGQGFYETATAVDSIRSFLPSVLQEVAKSATGENANAETDFATNVNSLLREKFGEAGKNPYIDRAINSVRSNLDREMAGERRLQGLIDALTDDVTGVAKRVTDPSLAPIQEFGKRFMEPFLGITNEYADRLAQGRKNTDVVGIGRDRQAEMEASLARTQAQIAAERNFQQSEPFRNLSVEQLSSGFSFRQSRLAAAAGIGGAGLSPQLFAEQYAKITPQLKDLQEKQRNAAIAGDRDKVVSVTKELDALRGQANNAAMGLKSLAESSQRAQAIQEKISALQSDKQGRLGFVERYYSSNMEQRLEMQRGVVLANQAFNNNKGLDGFVPQDQSLIIKTLRDFGSSRLTGFAGSPLAPDVLQKLLSNTNGGIGQLTKDDTKSLESLQKDLIEEQKRAIEAQKLSVDAQEAANNTLLSGLEKLFTSFFANLDRKFQQDTLQDLQNRKAQEIPVQRKQEAARKASDVLVESGISTDQQFERVSGVRDIIKKTADSNNAITEMRAAYESAINTFEQMPVEEADKKFGKGGILHRGSIGPEQLANINTVLHNSNLGAEAGSIMRNMEGGYIARTYGYGRDNTIALLKMRLNQLNTLDKQPNYTSPVFTGWEDSRFDNAFTKKTQNNNLLREAMVPATLQGEERKEAENLYSRVVASIQSNESATKLLAAMDVMAKSGLTFKGLDVAIKKTADELKKLQDEIDALTEKLKKPAEVNKPAPVVPPAPVQPQQPAIPPATQPPELLRAMPQPVPVAPVQPVPAAPVPPMPEVAPVPQPPVVPPAAPVQPQPPMPEVPSAPVPPNSPNPSEVRVSGGEGAALSKGNAALQRNARSAYVDYFDNNNLYGLKEFIHNIKAKHPDYSEFDEFANPYWKTPDSPLDYYKSTFNLPKNIRPFAFGGGFYASGGLVSTHPGQPSGTDTVPAWLTPHEFVVNAESSRANRQLLEMVNASRGPVYLANGGLPDFNHNAFHGLPPQLMGAGGLPPFNSTFNLRGQFPDNYSVPNGQNSPSQLLDDSELRMRARMDPFGPAGQLVRSMDNSREGLGRYNALQSIHLLRRRQLNAQSVDPFSAFGLGRADASAQAAIMDRSLVGRQSAMDAAIWANIPSRDARKQFNRDHNRNSFFRHPAFMEEYRSRLPGFGWAFGYADGGFVPHYLSGGAVDDVPAYLSAGEYVLPKSAVSRHGLPAVQKFAEGGLALSSTGGIQAPAGQFSPGMSAEVVRAIEQFGRSVETLKASFTGFIDSVAMLKLSFNGFSSAATELSQALSAFSGKLQVSGTQKVELVLLGGDVLRTIQGDLSKMVADMVRTQMLKIFKNTMPDIQINEG